MKKQTKNLAMIAMTCGLLAGCTAEQKAPSNVKDVTNHNADHHAADHKCAGGKCGGEKKEDNHHAADHKCAGGKCGSKK